MKNQLSKILNLIWLCLIVNLNTAYAQKKSYIGIEVHTGTESGAGTNANVFLTLKTTTYKGKAEIIKKGNRFALKKRSGTNEFESGDIDKFSHYHEVFDDISSINISHDNAGVGAGWYLKKLVITSADKSVYTFNCYRWLEGKGNGITLTPTNVNRSPRNVSKLLKLPYLFESAIGEKYLDVQWGATAVGTPLHLWPRNGGKAQCFYLEDAKNGYFFIRSGLDKTKYLYVDNGAHPYDAKVVLGKGKALNNDPDRTMWRFDDAGGGYYYINTKKGTYMDVGGWNSEKGSPIWVRKRNGEKPQKWKLVQYKSKRFMQVSPPKV